MQEWLEEIEQRSQALAVLQPAVDANVQRRAEAARLLKAFIETACDPATPFKPAPPLTGGAADYDVSQTVLQAQRQQVARAADEAGSLFWSIEHDPIPDSLKWQALDRSRTPAGEARGLLRNADTLLAHHAAFIRTRDEVRSRLAPVSLLRTTVIGDDATGVVVDVSVAGRKGMPSAAVRDTLRRYVGTQPRRRLFATAGWMHSTLRDNRFRPANLPSPPDDDPATPDTTLKLRYVNRNGRSRTVASPVLLTHVQLTNPLITAASVHLTTGLAYRTVADQEGIDYLVGLSASAWRRVFLTVAAHNGRVERFLPGSQMVGQPVSKNLTQTEAVGVERQWRIAFAVSLGI